MHFELKRAPYRMSFNRRSFSCLGFQRPILMKPVSRKTNKDEFAPEVRRTMNIMPSNPQPGDVDRCDYDEEERYDHGRAELWRNRLTFPGADFWDFKINILGVKDDTPIHFCDMCELPIKIYGRLIPCKHVFCYGCAILLQQKADSLCPNCNNPIQRIDQYTLGSLFMCGVVQECKRTYLSRRDLEAHINFRHFRSLPPVTPRMENIPTPVVLPTPEILDRGLRELKISQIQPEQHIRMPSSPLLLEPHTLRLENFRDPSREFPVPPPLPINRWGEQQDPYQFSTKKNNDMIFPIQNDSNSHVRETPLPVPARYSDYQDKLMISQPNPILPSWQLYGLPPQMPHVPSFPPPLPLPLPPPQAARYPMQLPSQATGMSSIGYSQAPLPSATSGPPQIAPSFDYVAAPMLPYVDHLSPGQLPLPQPVDIPVNVPGLQHYYPDSWPPPPEDEETLGQSYTQPWEMDPDLEPDPKGLQTTAPPGVPRRRRRRRRRMQGQGPPEYPLPGLSHDNQARFEPYRRQ